MQLFDFIKALQITFFDDIDLWSDFNVNVQWANLYLNEFDHIFLNGDNSVSIDENLDALNLESELTTIEKIAHLPFTQLLT